MFTENNIKEAYELISNLNSHFQLCNKSSIDDMKFQSNLNDILKALSSDNQINNKLLIKLEKFYQSSSLLIGLSSLKLDAETYSEWRKYDAFHFDTVKPNLQLYGPTIIV